jgi:hypothetical protein
MRKTIKAIADMPTIIIIAQFIVNNFILASSGIF